MSMTRHPNTAARQPSRYDSVQGLVLNAVGLSRISVHAVLHCRKDAATESDRGRLFYQKLAFMCVKGLCVCVCANV